MQVFSSKETNGKIILLENKKASGMGILNAKSEFFQIPKDWKLEPYTVVNLLGKYGDFEVDSNADGLADGWSASSDVTSTSLVTGARGNYAQKIVTDNSAGSGPIYAQLFSIFLTVTAGDVLFISAFLKVESEATTTDIPKLVIIWYDSAEVVISTDSILSSGTTQWEKIYGTATAPTNAAKLKARVHQKSAVGYISAYSVDAYAVYNLTKMGALPSGLQSYLGVTNWADLATTNNITAADGTTMTGEDWLNLLLPYVDSVATLGYAF